MIKCSNQFCKNYMLQVEHSCIAWEANLKKKCGFVYIEPVKSSEKSLSETELIEPKDDWVEPKFDQGDNKVLIEAFDPVIKVKHYQLFPEHDIEVRHVIDRTLGINNLNGIDAHYIACTLKYLMRCNRKGKFIEDIKKAKNYLDFIIENHNFEDV